MIAKFIKLFLLLSIVACKKNNNNTSIETYVKELKKKKEKSYLVYGDSVANKDLDSLVVISSDSSLFDDLIERKFSKKYLIPFDGQAIDLNTLKDGIQIGEKEKTINLIIDKSLYSEKDAKVLLEQVSNLQIQLNTILRNLYTGLKYKIIQKDTISNFELNTNGDMNADSIRKLLETMGDLKRNSDIIIVLVKEGDFLNVANALCVETESTDIILGDLSIFLNPTLLLHEIFHTEDLKHVEKEVCGNPGNIMDYRSIGCSHHISLRQVLHMNLKKFILPIKEDIVFPICNDCEDYFAYNSFTEIFVNSTDGVVVEMPIAGDHALLLRYEEEIKTGKMPAIIDSTIRNNYKKQASTFGFDSQYADRMIKLHNNLRQKNLKRWLKKNYEDLYPSSFIASSEQTDKYFQDIRKFSKINVGENNLPIRTTFGLTTNEIISNSGPKGQNGQNNPNQDTLATKKPDPKKPDPKEKDPKEKDRKNTNQNDFKKNR